MTRLGILVVLVPALFTSSAVAEEGPLVGQPLPELSLSHSLQGDAWSAESLRGSIVVIDLFQLGCPACMSNSMPEAQKLHERFKDDARVKVVAIATAFEKEQYPWMADEAKIKARLQSEGWKFPVMRDKDEKSVHAFGINGSYGTPTAVVIDASGTVRWHGWNSSKATAKAMEETVDELLESFWVASIPSFPKELKSSGLAYASGKYGKAYKAAKKAASEDEVSEEVAATASQIVENIDAGVERLVSQSDERRAAGFPHEARQCLETVKKVFKGVPGADAAKDKLSGLKKDKAFREELEAEKKFMKLVPLLENPQVPRDKLNEKLDALIEEFGETPVGTRIRAARGS